MVTKYDVFEILYKHRAPLKPIEIVRKLNKDKREYHAIHKYLRTLVEDGVALKKKTGFEADVSEKANLLYRIIYYCLKNGINYNVIMDSNFAKFISRALQKEEITLDNSNLDHRILNHYIKILDKYGLVLIISEKPIRIKVFYNILLNNLLVYFGYKHSVIVETKKDYIDEIKKSLAIYRRSKEENEESFKKIISEFEVSFVYHSLSLEGNPVTLPDTLKILRNEIIPANLRIIDVEEIKNYQQAVLQMLKDAGERKLLNIPGILEYHGIAMAHKPEIAGKIRQIGVYIKGNPDFKVAKLEGIKPELDKLFDNYNEFIKRKRVSMEEILRFAVYFHNEFQHIHPFEDGNSRTTRLITFHLLQSLDIPMFDIPFGMLDEYLSNTKGSRKREDEKLFRSLQKIILYNLKKINERL